MSREQCAPCPPPVVRKAWMMGHNWRMEDWGICTIWYCDGERIDRDMVQHNVQRCLTNCPPELADSHPNNH